MSNFQGEQEQILAKNYPKKNRLPAISFFRFFKENPKLKDLQVNLP